MIPEWFRNLLTIPGTWVISRINGLAVRSPVSAIHPDLVFSEEEKIQVVAWLKANHLDHIEVTV